MNNTSDKSIPSQPLNTAVLFMIFNRLDTTKQALEAISRAKPTRFYIAADGPRDSKFGEDLKIKAVRDYVINHIDWNCEIKTLFRDKNLGCKYAVSSAIDWFFEHEEMGIILEDDCLPHFSFFRFCEELLERYREDERIGFISGVNFQFGKKRTPFSYYFSRYGHIWGWASWSRTWHKFDVDMKEWPIVKEEGWLYDIIQNKRVVEHWYQIFDLVFKNKIDTWDYQFIFSCLVNSTLQIFPNDNLVSNIGHGVDAVHTHKKNKFSEIPTIEMKFPLSHPSVIIRDNSADCMLERDLYMKKNIITRVVNRIKKMAE